MKVLVCGGRDYRDSQRAFAVLDELHQQGNRITLLIEGGANGADRRGREWAEARKVPFQTVHADWAAHGRAAGPIRNAAMLVLRPDVVVAFPGGRGTADMVRRARAAGVRVLDVGRWLALRSLSTALLEGSRAPAPASL